MEEHRKKIYFILSLQQNNVLSVSLRREVNIPLFYLSFSQRNLNRRIVVRYFSNIIKVPFWPSFEDFRPRTKTSKCIISETENWRQNCCHFLVLCFVIIYEQKFSLYSLFCPSETFLEIRVPRSSLQWLSLPNFRLKKKKSNRVLAMSFKRHEFHIMRSIDISLAQT